MTSSSEITNLSSDITEGSTIFEILNVESLDSIDALGGETDRWSSGTNRRNILALLSALNTSIGGKLSHRNLKALEVVA